MIFVDEIYKTLLDDVLTNGKKTQDRTGSRMTYIEYVYLDAAAGRYVYLDDAAGRAWDTARCFGPHYIGQVKSEWYWDFEALYDLY